MNLRIAAANVAALAALCIGMNIRAQDGSVLPPERFSTILEMAVAPGTNLSRAQAEGYFLPGDGGGGVFCPDEFIITDQFRLANLCSEIAEIVGANCHQSVLYPAPVRS